MNIPLSSPHHLARMIVIDDLQPSACGVFSVPCQLSLGGFFHGLDNHSHSITAVNSSSDLTSRSRNAGILRDVQRMVLILVARHSLQKT